jgi:hypothetical protein
VTPPSLPNKITYAKIVIDARINKH